MLMKERLRMMVLQQASPAVVVPILFSVTLYFVVLLGFRCVVMSIHFNASRRKGESLFKSPSALSFSNLCA